MALDYASSLSPYPNKGKCGMEEVHESEEQVESKIKKNLCLKSQNLSNIIL